MENTLNKIPLLVFVFSLLFSSCYYDVEEELYPATNCNTDNVTWSGDIQPIIQSLCATSGCHVAGGSGNGIFENYAGVKEKVDNGSMMQRAVVQRDMPPSQPLSDCQALLIETWISQGAPEN